MQAAESKGEHIQRPTGINNEYSVDISQCDELKPSCTRCQLTLKKCIYPSVVFSASGSRDELSIPNLRQSNVLSLPPNASSFSQNSLSLGTSIRSSPAAEEEKCCSDDVDATLGLSDADLYHHYLEHTSRTLSHCQRDQGALQIGIPTLALHSKPVFHSLLALSAICMCCDMISKEQTPSLEAVNEVLLTGYRLYNLASEQMRESISQPDALKTEPLLASALLLVPFAAASQQVKHWISSKSRTHKSHKPHKPLSSTPRDVIVMMRGIKTTLQALDSHDLSTPQAVEPVADISSLLLDFKIPATLPPSHTHVMFPILAATSQKAFSKLQGRLESLNHKNTGYSEARCGDNQLSACTAAYEILRTIRASTFSPSDSSASPSIEHTMQKLSESESVPLLQVGPWLQSYAGGHAISLSTEPLTMRFLGFLVQVPQAYLDLVLPLLDQRLECPIGTPSEDPWRQLTKEQALALDIYAHWSVFMFLVEEESWWIGNLPIVTLTGMVNRYSDQFVPRLWPESKDEREEWWPGGMLTILREIKRCR